MTKQPQKSITIGTSGPLGARGGLAPQTPHETGPRPQISIAGRCREEALYEALRIEVARARCFKNTPWANYLTVAWITAAYLAGYALLLADPGWALRLGAVLVIAFTMVQAGFIAHEAGDGGITSNRFLASLIGQIYMTLASGLSCSYFAKFHRLHHAHLEGRASGAGGASQTINVYEGATLRRWLSRNGAVFIVVLTCLRGFTFKAESLRYLWRERKTTATDQVFMALHFIIWLVVPAAILGVADGALNFVLVTLLAGPYVGTVLLINHVGMTMARSQEGIPMLRRQTMATRNLGPSRWAGFVFGGINNHIEHHLFPEIPTANLPRARSITQDFFLRHGIPYRETSYLGALADIAAYFGKLSRRQLANESFA
jgi:fatty acid desaturase